MGKKRHKPEDIVAKEPEFGRRHLLALRDARSLSKYAGRLPASVVVCKTRMKRWSGSERAAL